jgi:DNA repair protein RecN (Recombination protein N)
MNGAAFRTTIEHIPDATSPVRTPAGAVAAFDDGLDVVRMRARTNVGEAEGSLESIASTGELSRIALVIKSLVGGGSQAHATLVFDEIDAGVGADLGDALAEKLLALASSHQILCITHMPQIAARASIHVGVAKDVDGARTRVRLHRLDGDARAREIARMLGGDGDEGRDVLARKLLAADPRRASASSRVRP